MAEGESPTLWIDVADFVQYLAFNPRPSGIQRLAFELMRALVEAAPDRVRFVRSAPDRLVELRWPEIESLYRAPPLPDAPDQTGPAGDDRRRSMVKRIIARMPPELRDPLFRAGVLQSQVLRQVGLLLHVTRPASPRTFRPARAQRDCGGRAAEPEQGDLLLLLGAPWTLPEPHAPLAHARRQRLRLGLLVHDLIP
ncbi:MAG TPA: hypothetical protein VE650_00230, partial [Acetobacteraceae bacterium]|nr:hypothetical protein [Acetobacteraceae bacterium]